MQNVYVKFEYVAQKGPGSSNLPEYIGANRTFRDLLVVGSDRIWRKVQGGPQYLYGPLPLKLG